MSAGGEGGVEEDFYDRSEVILAEQIRAEAENVAVVFLAALSGGDFVTLLAAGFRPVTVAMGNCVYGLDPRTMRNYRGKDDEIREYTTAFFDARELAMERLQHDLFAGWPRGTPDCPTGIVGMTVREEVYGGSGASGPPIVEFTALGTAIAPLAPNDPRRQHTRVTPRVVVPLDR